MATPPSAGVNVIYGTKIRPNPITLRLPPIQRERDPACAEASCLHGATLIYPSRVDAAVAKAAFGNSGTRLICLNLVHQANGYLSFGGVPEGDNPQAPAGEPVMIRPHYRFLLSSMCYGAWCYVGHPLRRVTARLSAFRKERRGVLPQQ